MQRYSTAAIAQLLQQRMVNIIVEIQCSAKVLLLTATDLIGSSEV